MILALAASIVLFPGRFVEMPMNEQRSICVSVVAPLGSMSPHDRAVARVLAKCLLDGTADYTRRQLVDLTLGNGLPLQCTVMPDHIRLQLGFEPFNLADGLRATHSILQDASLSEESISKALDALPLAKGNYWGLALQPELADYAGVKRREVLDLYRRAFHPANLSIAVSGPFKSGQARDRWLSFYSEWVRTSPPTSLPGIGQEKAFGKPSREITTIELAGPEFKGVDADFPARLLAAFALGAGKQSSTFRILREKLLVSYRQEALIWPTADGFRMRVIMALKPRQDEKAVAESAKQALIEDVASWGPGARERALAMARAVYVRGLPLNPLQLQASGTVGESPDDRTFMTAYWPMKTGQYWDEKKLLKSLEGVSLEQLKAAAGEALNSSSVLILSGG